MAEDISHPTNTPPPAPVEISQASGTTSAPVITAGDSGKPADTTVSPNPSPVTPVAGEDTGVTGEPGLIDYDSAKAAYLQNRANPQPPVPEAPAPVVETVVEQPTTPEPAPAPVERLPAIKIRPADESSMKALSAFKEYQNNGGNLNLIEWAAHQAPPATTQTPTPEPVVETPAAPETPGDEFAPETLTPPQIRQEIERVGKELREAMRAFDLATVAELQDQQTKLMLELPASIQREMQQQAVQQTQQQAELTAFERGVQEYSAQAHTLFGDAVFDPNSPLTLKAGEILAQMELEGDPIAFNPAASLVIYTKAAQALNIPMGANAPSVVTQQPASPVPLVAPLSIIAGGDGRTQTASRSAQPEVTPENYDQVKEAFLARRRSA